MKIGIDIRMLGRKRTGDETVFFNLVRHLALIDDENEYSLFLDKRSPEEMLSLTQTLGLEEKTNFRFVMLPTHNKFVWNFWTLSRYVREHPIDVYHTQYIVPFFVPKEIKIVTHIHDISFRVYPEYIRWIDRFFLGALIPRSLKRADKIIAVSEFTKREIMSYYKEVSPDKIEVVLNALSDDFMSCEIGSPEHIADIRLKYALPQKFILYVGTLQPRKNIAMLVCAFANIAAKLPEMKLVIVGNKKGHHYDARIDEAVRSTYTEEKVVFPGFIDQEDLPVLMQMAHIFVFPSMYEGFGLPVLEAMSQRVPVVASDIPSLREVGADAAVFTDANNLAKFSEILYTISTVEVQREALINAGIKRIHSFSWQMSAQHLQNIYLSLV